MKRELNETEVVMATCFAIMRAWQFNYNRRREWVIWASRHHRCSRCNSPEYSPCLNLADKKHGKIPRINRQPHDERIDWGKLLNGLKKRGYYRPQIEQQVRNQNGVDETLGEVTENRPMPDWAQEPK